MPETVLVTGASGGIGRACALRFARAGYRVTAHYHRSEAAAAELLRLARAEGLDLRPARADLTDSAAVSALFAESAARGEMPDILICNAGIAEQKLFTDLTDEDWRRMLDTNLSSAFYCARSALPRMIREKKGSIVFVSSIWGLAGASCEVHYSAAKAGLIGLTKALAKEVGPSGIRVNCVAPGAVATPMLDDLDETALARLREETPLGRLGTPEDIAEAIFYLAKAEFVTGQVLSPNGGFVI